MVKNNQIAVATMPLGRFDASIAGGINRCPNVGGKVHSFMKFGSSIYGVNAVAISRCHLSQVKFRNRLYCRNMSKTVLLFAGEFFELVK